VSRLIPCARASTSSDPPCETAARQPHPRLPLRQSQRTAWRRCLGAVSCAAPRRLAANHDRRPLGENRFAVAAPMCPWRRPSAHVLFEICHGRRRYTVRERWGKDAVALDRPDITRTRVREAASCPAIWAPGSRARSPHCARRLARQVEETTNAVVVADKILGCNEESFALCRRRRRASRIFR